MKTLIFVALSFLMLASAFSQQWTNRYDGTGSRMDAIQAMVVDNSGNVYVTGYSYSGANANDYITIKYNSSGVQQWLARYDGPGHATDNPNSIFVDNAGNVYVTGSSNHTSEFSVNTDIATVKYSPAGDQIWAQRYDGSFQRGDAGNAVRVDGAGNVYVTGYTTVHNGAYSDKDYITIKYSSAGEQQWMEFYNNAPINRDDEAIGIGFDASYNIYITGTSFEGNDPLGEDDYLTIKYNPSGIQQWTARYNGPLNERDIATGLVVDGAGNSSVTGYSNGGALEFATIKYNANGVQEWAARYRGLAGSSIPYAIALDNSGNIYVTGSDETIIYNSDYCTIKYNAAGIRQWVAHYNGTGDDNDEAQALAVDRNGNVFVTGYSGSSNYNRDIVTVKYQNTGVQEWVNSFNGARDSADVGNAIGVDSSGNVYVGGASTGSGTGWDFTTLKYPFTITGSQTPGQIYPVSFALSQNYPNPFNPSTIINYQLPHNSYVKLMVYDILGKEIQTLAKAFQTAGSYQVEWNANNFPAGVYFYRLDAGTFVSVMKMLLIK